jgi:multidrug efflux pump subunit AcrA (membrane-fusion protein)
VGKGRALNLRIPVYALHEAQTALRRTKGKESAALVTTIQQQIRDFRRMSPFAELVGVLENARSALSNAIESQIARLEVTIRELEPAVIYLPLTHNAVQSVQVFRAIKVASGEDDLLIFSCVMSDLKERQDAGDVTPSIFMTRNSRDFSDNARQLLSIYSCDLFTSYTAAVGRLRSELS